MVTQNPDIASSGLPSERHPQRTLVPPHTLEAQRRSPFFAAATKALAPDVRQAQARLGVGGASSDDKDCSGPVEGGTVCAQTGKLSKEASRATARPQQQAAEAEPVGSHAPVEGDAPTKALEPTLKPGPALGPALEPALEPVLESKRSAPSSEAAARKAARRAAERLAVMRVAEEQAAVRGMPRLQARVI